MTRWRETNHLRKYANEAGKKMRGPKRTRSVIHRSARDLEICARCKAPRYEHEATSGLVPDHDFKELNAKGVA